MKYTVILSVLIVTVASHSYHRNQNLKYDPVNVQQYSIEKTANFWIKNAQKSLQDKLNANLNKRVAKNIILFMGDGMSLPTTGAARMLLGGEEKKLSFEKFPYTGLSRTYCVNAQVPDSACTSTAYLTGVKGNYYTAGVTAAVDYNDCSATLDKSTHTVSIAKWAQDARKSTGFVTNTKVTHASPSGIYAHTASRDWESDSNVKDSGCNPKVTRDIAYQLINSEVGKKLNVIMGGGRTMFLNSTVTDEDGNPGSRQDGADLIEDWLKGHPRRSSSYVTNRSEMLSLNVTSKDYLLGLFASSHLPFYLETVAAKKLDVIPTLTEMTKKALDVLSKNKEGFFLFVEGGQIDFGHHLTQGKKALSETIEFSKAIEYARSRFREEDTLIVVTADHSHTMTTGGYPVRGANIFSPATLSDMDGLPFHTLSYANGPAFSKFIKSNGKRVDPSTMNWLADDYEFPAAVPYLEESHGADDVGIWASGPWAHLFTGNNEQSSIPHFMAYAAGIGNGLKAPK